jgi:hypothetical protein
MGDPVRFDTSAWPLLVIRMPAQLDADAIDSFLAGIDAVFTRKARFSAIVDTTALAAFPNAVARQRLVDGLNKRSFTEKAYNLGNGVVIVSAAARAVLTAINWVRPPVTTQYVVGDFAAALEWCCGRLVAANVALTPEIEALRTKGPAQAG